MRTRFRVAVLVVAALLAGASLVPASASGGGGAPAVGPSEPGSELVQWSVSSGGNGHWYRLSPRSVAGLDDAIALAAPGYVVSVLSEAEKDFLVESFGGEDLLLIGYTDRDLEGTWTWVSGEPSGYEFWASNEPNDCGSGPVPDCNPEDVTVMNWQHAVQPAPQPPGAWNDLPGYSGFAIFEYEARPDGRIRLGTGAPVGNDIYNTTGTGQTRTGTAARGQSVIYYVSAQNDARFPERLRLQGQPSTPNFTVRYRSSDDINITNQVTAGTFRTPVLAPQGTYRVKVVVTVLNSAPRNASVARTLTAISTSDTTRRDTVRFVTSRT